MWVFAGILKLKASGKIYASAFRSESEEICGESSSRIIGLA
jgi:hypothetical protein